MPTCVTVVRAGPLSFQQHITTLCSHFGATFDDVKLISLSSESNPQRPNELDDRVQFESIQWTAGSRISEICSRLKAAFILRTALLAHKVEIVYVIDSWTLPFVWVAGYFNFRFRGRPLVYHTFDMLEPGLHSSYYLRLESRACRAAALVVNTDRARAHYQKSLYRLKRLPLYVRNALPLRAKLPGRSEELRKDLFRTGYTSSSVIIAYPSRASSERLTLEVLNAMTMLPDDYMLFTIIAEDSYGTQCRKLISEGGLSHRVVVFPPIAHGRVTEICASADVGLVLHDVDCALGNFMCNPDRLARFVALGIPFVAAHVPNLEAEVYRYGLGVSCNPFDPQSISTALRALCEGKPDLAARRRHVRGVFERELHFEKGAVQLVQELADISGRNTSPHTPSAKARR